MTKQEKIIVSAYTGVLMCDFDDVHEYIQKKLGRQIFTHELADKDIQKEVEEKLKEEFLEICNREEPEWKKGKWEYFSENIDGLSFGIKRCSMCGASKPMKLFHWEDTEINFCPNCGADMREGEEK